MIWFIHTHEYEKKDKKQHVKKLNKQPTTGQGTGGDGGGGGWQGRETWSVSVQWPTSEEKLEIQAKF